MKKMLLVLSVMLACFLSHAQISRGSLFLGGDISGGTQKTKENGTTINKQSGLLVSPVVGVAVRENLIFGVNAGFMSGETKNPPSGNYETGYYALGVFLRKYRAIGTSNFYLFLQGGLNGVIEKQEYDNFNGITYDSKKTTISLNAYPGLSYAVNKKLHLETGFNNLVTINYFNERRDAGTPSIRTTTSGINISSSLNNPASLFLGIRLLIGKS